MQCPEFKCKAKYKNRVLFKNWEKNTIRIMESPKFNLNWAICID